MKRGKALKLILVSLLMASLFVYTGCSDDPVIDEGNNTENPSGSNGDETLDGVLTFEWISEVKEDTPIIIISGGETSLEYKAENVESIAVKEIPAGWEVNIDNETSTVKIKASSEGTTEQVNLVLLAKGTDGTEKELTATFHYVSASFDDPQGAFVLNEGNMTTENGSLIYITPDGHIINDVYKQVNGTELGNVCQDMAFCDGKIYIISQNGDKNAEGNTFGNDGMLVVLNAKTLKREKSFTNEQLSGLDWPSHIAVMDASHAYIRDNKGVWCLNTETGNLKFIEGTEGALKTHFATDGGVVYALSSSKEGYYPSNLLTITGEPSVELKNMSMFCEYHEIQPAGNNQLWGICSYSFMGESPTFSINKINISKPSSGTKEGYALNELPDTGASGHYFSVYNNTVYFTIDTSIYSRELNGKDTEINGTPIQPTKLIDLYDLDDNAIQQYNGLYINPTNGYLYINTIKGMGNFYTTNTIWVFDINGDMKQPLYRFDNYTSFPAGVFFPPQNE